MNYEKIKDIIKESKKILIISHLNPDGDALGSTCGLYSAIYANLKKKCDICTLTYVSPVYNFLPNIEYAKHNFDISIVYDLVITVDVASIDRIGEMKQLFDKAKTTINIDHHKTNNNFATYNYVLPEASSAGEVLYKLFKLWDWKIDLDTAECIYTAILTDTGGFRFDNTSADVFKIASELVEVGANPNKIYTYCYELKSKNFVLFQNHCIQKATFSDDNKIVYTTVYKRDLEKFKAKDDFTEGLTESLRAIESTDIAFIVKEVEPNKVSKISMRSKVYDVAKICSAFGGGGHSKAAGCTIKSSVGTAIKKVLDEIKKVENETKNV
ncbi:bifunctional oligoribonuclease/PAP phosphatase NrnA [bacterium]|nr:bifunctional oligoribonuclease/PAP phosphatase NrnA [bacterium]